MLASLGLILTVIFWVAGAYLLRTWRGTFKMSISQHAASAKGASRLFTAVLIVVGALFYYWLTAWFAPHLKLGFDFTLLLAITVVLLFIAATIPDAGGRKSIAHRTAAYGMAFLFLPLTYVILSSALISEPAKIIGYVCITYMITAALSAVFIKQAWDYYLLFQSLYIVAFQLVILSAAYV